MGWKLYLIRRKQLETDENGGTEWIENCKTQN